MVKHFYWEQPVRQAAVCGVVPGAAAACPPSFCCLLQLGSGPAQLPAFRGGFLQCSLGSVTCGSPTLPSMWLLGRGNGGSVKPALNQPCCSRNCHVWQPQQHTSLCKGQINLQTWIINIPRPATARQAGRDALPGVSLLYSFTGENSVPSFPVHTEQLRYAGEHPKDGSSTEGNWISSLKIHGAKPVYTSWLSGPCCISACGSKMCEKGLFV